MKVFWKTRTAGGSTLLSAGEYGGHAFSTIMHYERKEIGTFKLLLVVKASSYPPFWKMIWILKGQCFYVCYIPSSFRWFICVSLSPWSWSVCEGLGLDSPPPHLRYLGDSAGSFWHNLVFLLTTSPWSIAAVKLVSVLCSHHSAQNLIFPFVPYVYRYLSSCIPWLLKRSPVFVINISNQY